MVLQEINNAGTKVNPSRQGPFAKEHIDKTFVLCTAPFIPIQFDQSCLTDKPA
jgi:hypothetical protein